ncbi:MAG TPA: hypothetical protein VL129_01020 [Pseudomonas sp.]|uniref:hypothetical protein n=1 Tax=Pseudomonas sp. TaxID=306 RepID=UPI002BDC3CEC|nr:hypothetical protein [Pseudomonas sp.]HTO17717.1 hypothetical protein [Pseudomonas sp.]
MHSPTQRVLWMVLAVALAGVTIVSVGMAMFALIDDPRRAGLFAWAAVFLDVFKYLAWPLALSMLRLGRYVIAVLLMGCALVLGGVSGWATYDLVMSSMLAGRAQHQAIQEQRITDIEVARRDDQARIAALDAEARSVLEQADALRERGMASPARALQSSEMRRLDEQREQARARLEASSQELTALRSQPGKAASLTALQAILLCLGFAAALEIVPALILASLRASGRAPELPEQVEEGNGEHGENALLGELLAIVGKLEPGTRYGTRDFAKALRIGNSRAVAAFGLALERGAIRKTPAGYVVA